MEMPWVGPPFYLARQTLLLRLVLADGENKHSR
jgi:hypothetical protein